MRYTVRVDTIRAHCFAGVSQVNSKGLVMFTKTKLAVKFPDNLLGAYPVGSVWEVSGKLKERTYTINGFQRTEQTIFIDSWERINPEGMVLAHWISNNVNGIGNTIAKRLVIAVKNLGEVVLDGDIDKLVAVDGMTLDKADSLLNMWPTPQIYEVLKFLGELDLPAKLASPLIDIYGGNVKQLILTDPYVLVPLGVSLHEVEELIKSQGIKVSQDARDVAVTEDIAHQRSIKGSTVVTDLDIASHAQNQGYELSKRAGEKSVQHGALVQVSTGYQTVGMARMEAVVGHAISGFYNRKPGDHALLAEWERGLTPVVVKQALCNYEDNELGFSLTPEQREAVVGAIINNVACINGGAGVGKTTILKAIIGVYESFNAQGMSINLMALSGRAAQRMAQATGCPATTIAKYVYDVMKLKKHQRDIYATVIIDEASMVDLHVMYKLVRMLPDATRLLFVGDVAQLPPVGPGLIFHELVKSAIPSYQLSAVKRQAEDSGIHHFTTQARNGQMQEELPPTGLTLEESPDFSHSPDASLDAIRELWIQAGKAERSIVLAPTNAGELGVDRINAYLQEHLGLLRPRLYYEDREGGYIPWRIKGRYIHLGDQVMVTANDYKHGVRNGDLAVITEVFKSPTEEGEYGAMILDGKRIPIDDAVIEKLDLGFAVTIHKSQGSQWPVVILVLSPEGEKMTDRSLLYTGSTRPQEKLVILGDQRLIHKAICAGNAADRRKVALQEMLPQKQVA